MGDDKTKQGGMNPPLEPGAHRAAINWNDANMVTRLANLLNTHGTREQLALSICTDLRPYNFSRFV